MEDFLSLLKKKTFHILDRWICNDIILTEEKNMAPYNARNRFQYHHALAKKQLKIGRVSCSAQRERVGFFSIGSGRVFDKIPGSGSGSGRVGVSKYTIGYFRVSFFLSGISGYFGYFRVCRVFLGISGFTHIY